VKTEKASRKTAADESNRNVVALRPEQTALTPEARKSLRRTRKDGLSPVELANRRARLAEAAESLSGDEGFFAALRATGVIEP
jgi:hypothetical protein